MPALPIHTQQPYALNHFPHGHIKEMSLPVKCFVENENVVLSVLRVKENGEYVIRLFNNTDRSQETVIHVENVNKSVKLGKYEVKTLLYKENVLTESAEMLV